MIGKPKEKVVYFESLPALRVEEVGDAVVEGGGIHSSSSADSCSSQQGSRSTTRSLLQQNHKN